MDDIVKQAIEKWPNVPFAYGWLGLDARGQWYLRNAAEQALGGFASGVPHAKGTLIEHAKLVEFIARNYEHDERGQYFFQNGPQRAYVELEAAPYVFRFDAQDGLVAHTGQAAVPLGCLTDEQGRVYFDTDLGLGLLHSLDVARLGDLVERGVWAPEEISAATLPQRFGFVPSPLANQAGLLSKE